MPQFPAAYFGRRQMPAGKLDLGHFGAKAIHGLIISDILGLNVGPMPKFSKNYADLSPAVTDAVRTYAAQIRGGIFPDDAHSYHLKPGHLEKLQQMLKTLRGE